MIFSPDEFFAILELYNRQMQAVMMAAGVAGLVCVAAALVKRDFSGRLIAGLLGVMWVFVGLFFFMRGFGSLTSMAYVFGAGFVLQGFLLAWSGVVKRELVFAPAANVYSLTGSLFVAYALIGYLLVGQALGRESAHALRFGISSGPLVVFTMGLLLWVKESVPRHLIFLPFMAGAMESVFLLSTGMFEDIAAGVAGVAGSLLILHHDKALVAARLRKSPAIPVRSTD